MAPSDLLEARCSLGRQFGCPPEVLGDVLGDLGTRPLLLLALEDGGRGDVAEMAGDLGRLRSQRQLPLQHVCYPVAGAAQHPLEPDVR